MSDVIKQLDIIGRGFTYPFHINEDSGAVEYAEGTDDIIKSIMLILDTQYREFPGNRGFGCGIDDLVFSSNDSANDLLFQHFVLDAIDTWEPRVQVMSVNINRSNSNRGILEIGIDFFVLQTREPASMVYPFYLDT